jgi:hypothetical protein
VPAPWAVDKDGSAGRSTATSARQTRATAAVVADAPATGPQKPAA